MTPQKPGGTSLVANNGVICSVRLLQRTPWYTWITVWPFTIAFVLLCVFTADPSLLWGKVTYLIYMKYIDFLQGVMFPVLIMGNSFLALLTVWSVRVNAFLLYQKRGPNDLKRLAEDVRKRPKKSPVTPAEARYPRAAQPLPSELDRPLPVGSRITHVLVEAHPHKGQNEMAPLRVDSRGRIFFNFQRRKWTLTGLDAADGTSKFDKPTFPTKHAFRVYGKDAGLRSQAAIDEAYDTFGPNELTIEIPTFMELFVDHAFAPFFVFQMFCVILWSLDQYVLYSMFTGFMMVALECLLVHQRLRNMRMLQQMSAMPPNYVQAWRNDKYITVSARALLPMDVIAIPMNSPCPADMLLISGTCVVNESMLTGESTPQMKECLPLSSDEQLNSKRHSRHILYAGTQILLSSRQTSCAGDGAKIPSPYPVALGADGDKAVGVVLRIGLETKQGKLVRTIWHSQARVSQNSSEAFLFIGFLLAFALVAVGYVLRRDLGDSTRSRWKLFLTCTQILTSVVPPELPMELTLAVNTSLLALVKLFVFCTEPFRIPFAGKVDTCCFDKTGTLTTDEMLFCGVECCDAKQLRNKAALIPQDAEQVLASCHALVTLDSTAAPGTMELAGDAMEKAAVEALGWACSKTDFMTKEAEKTSESAKASRRSAGLAKSITILVRFPFLPALKRMSCIVSDNDGVRAVVCKGAPEIIKPLLQFCPTNYDDVCRSHTKAGLRVIALARRQLSDAGGSRAAVAGMPREAAERDLLFAGFAVFKCPLKQDSRKTIENLQSGSHRCTIITGDSLDTAVAVGREVGIVPAEASGTPSLVAASNPHGGGVQWLDANTLRPFGAAPARAALCVDGEKLSAAEFTAVCDAFVSRVSVWARCAPRQKEDIVTSLKSRGHMVLMAGDGTNDVGGLKQAHVGIAVLNSGLLQQSAKAAASGTDPLSQAVANFKVNDLPREPPPDAGFMAKMKYEFAKAKQMAEQKHKERLEENLKKQKSQITPSSEKVATPPPGDQVEMMTKSMFNEMDDISGAPMVKLGDASIAAPFTCRSKKMESICDIVRLGRCTLATTIQMYKILALNCLTTAYTLSVLYSDGVKFGDKQMMFSGMLIAICFLLISRSKPVETLSTERPITTVFHPYIMLSIMGQFAVHLYSFIQCVQLVSSVDANAMDSQRADVDSPDFKPTLLNSIMFLMTTLMNVVTFVTNYCGRPFMTGITENRGLMIVLGLLAGFVAYCAFEVDPQVNEQLEIVPFPSEEFRSEFVKILAIDVVGSIVAEFSSRLLFGRFAKPAYPA